MIDKGLNPIRKGIIKEIEKMSEEEVLQKINDLVEQGAL
jgi:hypothetical protein